ncbi:MAG: hypothetical protein COW27_06265 [Nitrosopumilales archaeon CG15_BIG_FIL_POST_REV_8_21_14_020_37_12]|nr:MAG: hypothetical protein COW27_06265 [Nitrosopumilales archaeon CG15_BIG_FIL_POST_REV_8_21_14_020_37_12]
MKSAPCSRCSKKFNEKDIYTIQQFQYRQEPNYEWTKKFLDNLKVGEWDSLCEQCVKFYAEMSMSAWRKGSKR